MDIKSGHCYYRPFEGQLILPGDSLFFVMAVKETGPLEAGLLTAHPKDRGDSHHQHHQILNEEEGNTGPAYLLHLSGQQR